MVDALLSLRQTPLRRHRFRVLELSLLAACASLAVAASAARGITLPVLGVGGNPIDFGGVRIGEANVQTLTVPLVVHASDLPPEFVVYRFGDNSAIDEAILANNLLGGTQITDPVTVTEFIGLFGDVTVSYTLSSLSLDHGIDFILDPGDCINASGPTCTASLTFAPHPGAPVNGVPHDVLRGQIGSIAFSGGNGQLSGILNQLSAVIVSELNSFFAVTLDGTVFPALAIASVPTLSPAALAGLALALALVGTVCLRR